MDLNSLDALLKDLQDGRKSREEAVSEIQKLGYEDIGFAKVDHARSARQGFPEVILGEGKTPEQIEGIFDKLEKRASNLLITRTDSTVYERVKKIAPDAEWHEAARLIRLMRDRSEHGIGEIAVVTAGTSDIPVAEEAALTAEAMGNRVNRVWDAGVAGIHRILSQRETLRSARVVVVAAGMEGALPSVVGGLVSVPVVAVPTSIGYGASFNGLAALLGMLNSCSSNVTVVNIDNGFGAGFVSSLINRKPAGE
jgi:pyridinium-3,5-biscarboxylic acid mononucleotide synthase